MKYAVHFSNALVGILLFFCQLSSAQTGDCNLTDPLFDYEPEWECCIDQVCYDIGAFGSPWDDIGANGPFVFDWIKYDGQNIGPAWPEVETFETYEELAETIESYLFTELGVTADFYWDANAQSLCATIPPGASYGNLHLCCDPVNLCDDSPIVGDGQAENDNCLISVPAEFLGCPYTEPDITDILDPSNANIDNSLEIITGYTIGDFIGDNPNTGNGPTAQSMAIILQAMLESGALQSGAGCFNLNCVDLPSLAEQYAPGSEFALEMETIFPNNVPGDFDDWEDFFGSLQSTLTSELANVNLVDLINESLGWNFPNLGDDCPPNGMLEPPLTPFTGGGGTGENESKSQGGGNSHMPMMNGDPGTGADYNIFDQMIPGLGIEGPGAASPSPSAMAAIEQIKGGVDLYNGSQSSSVPLYNFQSNDISLPISISSSNNGLKVNDMGSLVGQHWNLNVGGSISRVVNGLPDEYKGTVEGIGVGRNYKINARLEVPTSIGLRLNFPGASSWTPPPPQYQFIINGFTGDCAVSGAVYLKPYWTPLQPNIVSFVIGIKLFSYPPPPLNVVDVYLEIGFNAGISLNEKLGNIHYEEKGLGFLHLDNPGEMEDMELEGYAANFGTDPRIKELDENGRLAILKSIHAVKGIEDTKFFNDQIANWDNWIEAIADLVGVERKYKTKKLDTEPDEFYFNFGSYSGKFSFNTENEPVFFPAESGLEIEDVEYTADEKHIARFTVNTSEGMQYTFGSTDLVAVDVTENTNYYLPNFYTYPEADKEPTAFGKAKVDLAQIMHMPFIGPRFVHTYGNTYERNYRIMESPKYTSTWHLVEVKSLLTQEVVGLEYDSRDLSYYADKNYSHSFPNFGTDGDELVTEYNTNLNPINNLSSTKWENGRAEFAYSVTETSLRRWHLTSISAGRNERVMFSYDCAENECGSAQCDRGEIAGDKLLSRIDVMRNGNLYKGWSLSYGIPTFEEGIPECNGETLSEEPEAPLIAIGGETNFSLGDKYEPNQWFDFHTYLFFNFRAGCFTLPMRLPIPQNLVQLGHFKDFGYRTNLTEYGSLMEVKALNGLYDEAKEAAIFNAEKKRSFLQSICEIDRDGDYHSFVDFEYENDAEGLPKRFSVHQDLFGYHNDNSLTGSPLPPIDYSPIVGSNQITSSDAAAENHFGFHNVDANTTNQMRLGQNEAMDENLAKIGALSTITLASGGSISYVYEPNMIDVDGTEVQGAGLRIFSMTEDPNDTAAKTTEYEYAKPTTIWKDDPLPIRVYQSENDYYYRRYFYLELCDPLGILEQRVVTTSGPQNMMYSNKNNHVGYQFVTEKWEGVGRVLHQFSNPENLPTFCYGILDPNHPPNPNVPVTADNKLWELRYGASPDYTCIDFEESDLPPGLRVPSQGRWQTWLMGIEMRTEVFNNDDSERQVKENIFECSGEEGVLKYTKSQMYQNNHPGSFYFNYAFRKIPQFVKFSRNFESFPSISEEDAKWVEFIEFLVKLIVQQGAPHPYRKIERNYLVSDREMPTTNIRLKSTTVTNTYANSATQVTNTYDYPNIVVDPDKHPRVPISVTTESDGETDHITEYFFVFDSGSEEVSKSDGGAITYLADIGYTPAIASKTSWLTGGTFEENMTALAKENDRIVPLSNWTLRNGTLELAGTFSEWNTDGKPIVYEMATYNGVNSFPGKIELVWNNQLQLESRKYGSPDIGYLESTYEYNDYFELKKATNADDITTTYGYDPRGRLELVNSLNGRQETLYEYTIAPGGNQVQTTLTFTGADAPPAQVQLQKMDGFGKPTELIRMNDGALLSSNLYDGFFRTVGNDDITKGITTIEYMPSPMPFLTTVTDAEGNVTVTEQMASADFFEAERVTDPNEHTTFAHVDGLGRTRQTITGEVGSTFYEFDDLNRLVRIVNPEEEEYMYEYNGMDNVVRKTVPGAEEYSYWFDEQFRLAAMQDGNGEVIVYQYDDYSRLLGIYHFPGGLSLGGGDPENIVNSAGMSSAYNGDDNWVLKNTYFVDPATNATRSWVATVQERVFSPDFDELENFTKETHNSEISDIGEVLMATINYPSDYGVATVTVTNTINSAQLVTNVTKKIYSPGEFVTVSHEYAFDDILRLEEAMFDGEVISRLEYNEQDLVMTKHLGKWSEGEKFLQKVDYAYDKTGRLIRINDPANMECTEGQSVCEFQTEFCIPYFISTKCGILTEIEVNGETFQVDPPFDLSSGAASGALGHLIEEALAYFGFEGEVSVTSYVDRERQICYQINITGTKASSITLITQECQFPFEIVECCVTEAPPNQGSGLEPPNLDLFYEKIEYYGIDISSIEYFSDCRTGKMVNHFTYDANHRVTNMDNVIFNPGRTEDWYTSSFGYDAAGNIMSIMRNGMFEPTPGEFEYGVIDNLTYTYVNENSMGGVPRKRLTNIADGAPSASRPEGFFSDDLPLVYDYDGNGNVLNSQHGDVTWNVINMPLTASVDGGDMKFDYSFFGEKIRVQLTGEEEEDRLYLAGAEFVKDAESPTFYKLDNCQHEEGRKQYRRDGYDDTPLDPRPAMMQYQITDHLGNLAVLFSDADNDGEITSELTATGEKEIEVLQRQFYYPFGMSMDGTWREVGEYNDRYKYNHKEQIKGLGWYAYGFRYYDAAVGRFMGVDPIAEQFAWVSSYNYAENEPVGHIDLWGLQAVLPAPVATLISSGATSSALPPPVIIMERNTAEGEFEDYSKYGEEASSPIGQSQNNAKENTETDDEDRSGLAIIHKEEGTDENPFGHYSIEVIKVPKGSINIEEKLHTEQVIDGRSSTLETTISPVFLTTSDEKRVLYLPDAQSALDYQKTIIGKNTGPYSKTNNSCLTHVCNVLREGGVDVPETAKEQYIEARKIFKK